VSSLCSFLQPPVTSSLFGPNILLSTLFSNTLILCIHYNTAAIETFLMYGVPIRVSLSPPPFRALFMLETTEFAELYNLHCIPLKREIVRIR
jgi:hypothetical protein